ncbi:HAMP domain-containing histidine kinase [Bacillus sp. BGMRC 2118]|nr:HAMP domain-containing histidine kinase [Bacillus sp. BGMRC 2118]
MMRAKQKTKRLWSLTAAFSLIVFIVLTVTMTILAIIVYVLIQTGILPRIVPDRGVLPGIPLFMLNSILIGTIIARFISTVPILPIQKLIYAIEQLSEGNFQTRIDMKKVSYLSEFHNLTNSFNKLAEELESIELLRTDFIQNFSHEFKTPISSIQGFAKLLKNSSITEDEKQEYLNIIISETERMSGLADNILMLSKLENQSILSDRSMFNITEVMNRTIILLEPMLDKKNIELNLQLEQETYFGNEDLIGQVFLNIIENSIKFSENNGLVSIKMHRNDDCLRISITDNGCGMNEKTQKHIFDKFYQGDTSRTNQGNGIGLSIVKRIIDLHGGHIAVQSKGGKGTTFTIELDC